MLFSIVCIVYLLQAVHHITGDIVIMMMNGLKNLKYTQYSSRQWQPVRSNTYTNSISNTNTCRILYIIIIL